MSIARRLAPYLSAVLTDPTLASLQRTAFEAGRRIRMQPHRVLYFHQVDDPYSHLAVQTLERLAERYAIELVPHLVGPPPDDAAPERARLEAYARKDAADIARPLGLAFPAGATAPDPALVRRVTSILAAAAPAAFPRRAVTLGTALWSADATEIERLAALFGATDDAQAAAAVEAGNERRKSLGHYLGGMFRYGGEWYWSVDRLHYLEERLRSLGVAKPTAPAEPIVAVPRSRPVTATPPAEPIVVDAFLSLRSPYSYIVMERTLALPQQYPVELRLRPVLPMVMRGLPAPLAKRMYIVRDTKREADRMGVAFGWMCDPVGEPVERGFALYRWARDLGRAGEYLHAFTRAAFAEGIDIGSDEGLRHVVESAGLSWEEAQAHRNDREWRDELEANRVELFDLGLWGVPSFRVSGGGAPPFATWGQDRMWLVERAIVQRLNR